MKTFGTLMTFDCGECNGLIDNKQIIDDFITKIVNGMNMKRIGEPTYEWFGDTPFNRENDLIGYSVTQIISLSSITLHICSISKSVFIDVFTCCKVNDLTIDMITHNINISFNPKTIIKKQIHRCV